MKKIIIFLVRAFIVVKSLLVPIAFFMKLDIYRNENLVFMKEVSWFFIGLDIVLLFIYIRCIILIGRYRTKYLLESYLSERKETMYMFIAIMLFFMYTFWFLGDNISTPIMGILTLFSILWMFSHPVRLRAKNFYNLIN